MTSPGAREAEDSVRGELIRSLGAMHVLAGRTPLERLPTLPADLLARKAMDILSAPPALGRRSFHE